MPNVPVGNEWENDDGTDRGTWEAMEPDDNDRVGIASSYFPFDVVLYVSGDFWSLEQKKDYAKQIAERLNATIPT